MIDCLQEKHDLGSLCYELVVRESQKVLVHFLQASKDRLLDSFTAGK